MEGIPFPLRWLPVQYLGQIRFLFVASNADYLIPDAPYERVREAGVIAHQAVLIAIGINWEGQRQVLAVEMAKKTREPKQLEGIPSALETAWPVGCRTVKFWRLLFGGESR